MDELVIQDEDKRWGEDGGACHLGWGVVWRDKGWGRVWRIKDEERMDELVI